MGKKVLVVDDSEVLHVYQNIAALATMGRGGVFGNELKMLRPKKEKVFTEFDQKRIDAAKAKRDRRNLKRLAK